MIPPVTAETASPDAAAMLDGIAHRFGMVPNIFGVMAQHPPTLKAFLSLYEAIQQPISPRLRELTYLRSSALNGCGYCTHHHRMAAQRAGLTGEQIEAALAGNPAPFNALEQTVLQFAEQLTRTADVSPDVREQLEQQLEPDQFVALTMVVCVANMTNRFNHACGVQLP